MFRITVVVSHQTFGDKQGKKTEENGQEEASKGHRRDRQKKIEIGSERGLYKYINRQAVDVQNEREENTKHTHRDNKIKY